MTTESTCASCQQPVPDHAPLGLCPQCLLKGGFYTGSASASKGGRFTAPPVEDLVPLFPQLEIMELIGRGGMGAVYKARQPRLNRLVALKILARDSSDDARFAERFQREAQALAHLNHPNIVIVYDFGEAGGLFYLVMEFVDGLNLRQLEQSKTITPAEALAIVPPICEAMQYAHEREIVHRDIKPENILVDKDGRVKLADFGIAKLLGSEGQEALTGADQRMGTPHYMAPEQVEKPATVDHRADIYSLGVVFYEMLTGELPLGRFAPPSRKVQIDVRLDEIVLRALEKEPELRFQHASEIRVEVETLSTPAPPSNSVPLPPPPQPSAFVSQETSKRGKGAGFLAVIFVLAAISPFPLGVPERVVLVIIALGLFVMYRSLRDAGARGLASQGLATRVFDTAFQRETPGAQEKPDGTETQGSKALSSGGIALLAIPVSLILGALLSNMPGFYTVHMIIMFLAVAAVFSIVAYGRSDVAPSPPAPLDPLPSVAPDARLSRLALIGGLWAFVGFGAIMGALTSVAIPQASDGTSNTPLWMIISRFTLLPLGLLAPFASTVLGYVSFSQIKRSGGKLYGYGLAVFDALAYPLAVLAVALGLLYSWLLETYLRTLNPTTAQAISNVDWFMQNKQEISVALSIATVVIVAVLLVRRIYRGLETRPKHIGGTAGRKRHYLAVALCGALLTYAFVWAGFHLQQYTESHLWQRAAAAATCGAIGFCALWLTARLFRSYQGSRTGFGSTFVLAAAGGLIIWLLQPHPNDHIIRGQVVDTMTGMPLPGVNVALQHQNNHDEYRMPEPISLTQTNARGEFRMGIAHSVEYVGKPKGYRVPMKLSFEAQTYFNSERLISQIEDDFIVVDMRQHNQGPESPRFSSDRSVEVRQITLQDTSDDGYGIYVYATNHTSAPQQVAVEFFNHHPVSGDPQMETARFTLASQSNENLFMPLKLQRSSNPYNHAEITLARIKSDLNPTKNPHQLRLMGASGNELIFIRSFKVPPRGHFHLALLRTDSTEKTRSSGQGSRDTLTFTSRATARLEAISSHPYDGRFWNASGQVLQEAPAGYDGGSSETQIADQRTYSFFILLENAAREHVGITYKVKDSMGLSGGLKWLDRNARLSISATLPADVQATDVSVGIAVGPWRGVATGQPGSSLTFSTDVSGKGGQSNVTFSQMSYVGDELRLTVHDTALDKDYQIAAVDTSGFQHIGASRGSSASNGLRQTTVAFDGLTSAGDITKLQFQARDFEWKTFNHVRLVPHASSVSSKAVLPD